MTWRPHVTPMNDLRDHVVEQDGLCPCLPRVVDGVVMHNSYDRREVGEVCRRALDLLGVALADHDHDWGPGEREAYDHAIAVLDIHWPAKASEPPLRRRF